MQDSREDKGSFLNVGTVIFLGRTLLSHACLPV